MAVSREDQKRRSRERLDVLLVEGLDSGKPIPATAELWSRLKRDALAKLNSSDIPGKGRSRKVMK